MSIIRSVTQKSFQPPIKGGSAKIADLKMQIAELKYKEQTGVISKEEAQVQIMALESKIEQIEFGTVQESPQNNSISNNPDSTHSQDAFFDQQALYNRAFHNL